MFFRECECYQERDDSCSESGQTGNRKTETEIDGSFEEQYKQIALNCFRYLDYKSFKEVDELTIPEYNLLMKAVRLKHVDQDYRNHLQAFLNFAVKAERKVGKSKTKPVYQTFKKFYDYEKELNQILEVRKSSRFQGIEKFFKKGGNE